MNVLVALDDSPYAEMVIRMSLALPLPAGSRLTVASVVPEPTLVGGITLGRLLGLEEGADGLMQSRKQSAKRQLESAAKRLRAGGSAVETVVATGRVAERLLGLAQEVSAELIILGARGSSDAGRFALGGVAQQVVKHAACGVLLVRQEVSRIGLVLIGIDGSPNSVAVARFVAGLPLSSDTQVRLVTALHSHSAAFLKMPTMDLAKNRRLLKKIQTEEERGAREMLGETTKLFADSACDVQSDVCHGDPATRLLEMVERSRPALVAVGAMGLTGIELFLMGSVAQRIARRSPCSVLVSRP